MAITKSAKKAIRSSAKKRVFNLRRTRAVKDSIKEIDKLLKEGKIDEARKLMSKAQKAIDKAVKMNTMKKNTASRKKSRLSAKIKKTEKK